MADFLQSLDFWHWWLGGVVLVILEIFAPGIFLLWIGLSALAVGVLVWLNPGMFWYWQWLIFAGLSVGFALLGHSWFSRRSGSEDEPALNRRGEQYVGRVFTLGAPVVNGVGKLVVDDSTWKVFGADCDAGTKVRVTGADGVLLRVEPVEAVDPRPLGPSN
jgi:membrane protein implicated in regulation of membrane protease activity